VRDRSGVAKERSQAPEPGKGNGRPEDLDLKRLRALEGDRAHAARDQSAADADQTGSDEDQTSSDVDQDLSDRDRRAADRDQIASERDQEISDRELEAHPSDAAQQAHDASRAERELGATDRRETKQDRALVAEERLRLAARRDVSAWHRDLTAQARDMAADRRDDESVTIESKMGSRGSPLREALLHAAEIRAQATRDRARAAEDRAQAAADRERAAEEREVALRELRRAHLDELTGAFRRGSGESALQAEIDRARRGDGRLVLAFLDVDSLREVNNRDGHAAGDALLRDVVAAIRSKIRSYEPVVRFGGDEFVCAIGGLDLSQAEERFRGVRGSVAAGSRGAGVSVGLAELRRDDTLGDLIERADSAMLEARRTRHHRAD
jgi:diguanylate cyclase (GGDEF)-like protein